MNELGFGGNMPGDLEPDYNSIIRYHAEEKKRRRRRLIVIIILLVIAGGAGYYAYHRYLRFDHLITKLDVCTVGFDPKDPGLKEPCKSAVEDLSSYPASYCKKIVNAINVARNADQRNLLLYALLKGAKESLGEGMQGNVCIEEAIFEVHKKTCREENCRPMGYFVSRPQIWGIASYNQALIPWGIHVRLIDRLDLKSLTASLQSLGGKLDKMLTAKDAQLRRTAQSLAAKYLLPAVSKTYQAFVENQLTTENIVAARKKPLLPKNFSSTLAAVVPSNHPLAEKILDHFFQRVVFTINTSPADFKLHVDFLNRVIQQKGWLSVLKRRLAPLKQRSHRQLLLLLASLEPRKGPTKASLEQLLALWAKEFLAYEDEAIGADPSLAKITAAAPTVNTASWLLMRRPKMNYYLDQTLKNLKQKKQDPSELIRRTVMVLLNTLLQTRRCPNPVSIERHKSWLIPEFKWLFHRYGKKLKHCWFPPRDVWLPLARVFWPSEVRQQAIHAAKTRSIEDIEMLIDNADSANARFFGYIALSKRPFKKRLALVRKGLRDPLPSIRAAAAFAAGYGVRREKDFNRIAYLLTPMAKDRSWVARLSAFTVLARSDEMPMMYPFLNDTSPLITAGWKRIAKTWDTDRVEAFLDRRDRGAGIVLLTALRRTLKKGKASLTIPSSTLRRLAHHKSEMVRAELTRALVYPNLSTNLKMLFKDKSPWVRRRALMALTAVVQNPQKSSLRKQLEYLPQAVERLQDPIFEVQQQAEAVFTSIVDPGTLPHLAKLAQSNTCPVKRAALMAIARLKKTPQPSLSCPPEGHN